MIIEKLKEILKDSFVFQNSIILGYRGSIAQGTYQPQSETDDKDVLGVCIPPKEYILGLKRFEQCERRDKESKIDLVVYDIRKFFRLLLNNNPNVLNLLWLREEHYIRRATPLGNLLIKNRDIFISKRCYKTFVGYAYSQLRKMETGNVYGDMGAKRKALVDKFGYDTKNASHLVRLLRMGMELLSTGEVNVFRHDSQQLIAIKNGEWDLERVKEEADSLFKLVASAYVKSKLPKEPDWKSANELLIYLIEKFWKEKEEKI